MLPSNGQLNLCYKARKDESSENNIKYASQFMCFKQIRALSWRPKISEVQLELYKYIVVLGATVAFVFAEFIYV